MCIIVLEFLRYLALSKNLFQAPSKFVVFVVSDISHCNAYLVVHVQCKDKAANRNSALFGVR